MTLLITSQIKGTAISMSLFYLTYLVLSIRDKHIDTITKVNYVLVEHLSNIVNATLNYSVQPTWGYRGKNNKWSGMIGELTRKEAVIGGTALFLTTDRVSEIDYIAMTTPTKSKFVFRQPKLSYVTNVYTLPFHWSVWVSTIAFVVLTIIVLYFVVKWEWQKKSYDPDEVRLYSGGVCKTIDFFL